MLIVSGTIKVASEEELARVQPALAGRAERSRRDAGCLDYAFSVSLDDPTEIRLIEKWASQADLDAHLAVPDPEFSELLATAQITAAVVTVADTSEEREMMRR
jgi:quinol monooxygenase YgiN